MANQVFGIFVGPILGLQLDRVGDFPLVLGPADVLPLVLGRAGVLQHLGDGDGGTATVIAEVLGLVDLPDFAGHLGVSGSHPSCLVWRVHGVCETHSWTGVPDPGLRLLTHRLLLLHVHFLRRVHVPLLVLSLLYPLLAVSALRGAVLARPLGACRRR